MSLKRKVEKYRFQVDGFGISSVHTHHCFLAFIGILGKYVNSSEITISQGASVKSFRSMFIKDD